MTLTMNFDVPKNQFRCGFGSNWLWLLVVTIAFYNVSSAQVTLYDNLDNVLYDGDWHTALGSDRHYAQQFHLGENTNIDQVSILLQRPQAGVQGSLRFELWHDDGTGKPVEVGDPAGKIADLGKILDVTEIPIGRFGLFTLDNLVLGLEPNRPYWIVTDYEDVTGISGGWQSLGWAGIWGEDPPSVPVPDDYDPAAGTNGAAFAHVYRNQNPYWADLADFFGATVTHHYQALKIDAMEIALDIDILSSAIRQELIDAQYDINQDGLVNADDRTHWIQDLGNTWFGDANLDGEFNSADLTLVFQSDEYEDNITLNSSWAEGDWNGNGDFESGDLIVAFQDGGYEIGSRTAVNAVPEPTYGMLLAIGAIAIFRLRKS